MEIIAIIGRPNVGKSSLFNRIVGKRKSIVHQSPGVTRDRIYAEASFDGKNFILVDTGGFEPSGREKIKSLILKQTEAAIREADKLIVVFDAKSGILPDDFELVNRLRKIKKDTFYAVNKIDNREAEENITEFYSFGIDKLFMISAMHGNGVSDLLEDLSQKLKEEVCGKIIEKEKILGLAIIGRPNVGKSLIVNRILQYERVMVDNEPGTTRDAVDSSFVYKSKKYLLIDTAGIRRRSRIEDELEAISVMAALKAVERAEFVILVIDASREIATQDLRVADYSISRGKALLVVINKIDLALDYNQIDFGEFRNRLIKLYPAFSFCPFIFVSALLERNIDKIMDSVEDVNSYYNLRIRTKDLNKFFKEFKVNFKLGYIKGRRGIRGKLKYITQIGVAPPRFLIFCNNPEYIRDRYDRFIKNQLRKKYIFRGVPIEIIYKKS